jgi:hypothetical protein
MDFARGGVINQPSFPLSSGHGGKEGNGVAVAQRGGHVVEEGDVAAVNKMIKCLKARVVILFLYICSLQ